MAYGMGLFLHLKTGRGFSTNEWMCLVPSVVGSGECGLTSTEARLPQPQRAPHLGNSLLRTSFALQLSQNLTPVCTGFTCLGSSMPSLTCNRGKLLRALMLLLTLACPAAYSSSSIRTLLLPTSSLSSFFRHMLTTVISSHPLPFFCYIHFISFHSAFPYISTGSTLGQAMVPHVWTIGDTVWSPRDILIWGHLEGKGKGYREL